MDCPGLRGHSCDPQICCHLAVLSLWSHFSPSAGPHLSLGLDEDEDGEQGGGGVLRSQWGWEAQPA